MPNNKLQYTWREKVGNPLVHYTPKPYWSWVHFTFRLVKVKLCSSLSACAPKTFTVANKVAKRYAERKIRYSENVCHLQLVAGESFGDLSDVYYASYWKKVRVFTGNTLVTGTRSYFKSGRVVYKLLNVLIYEYSVHALLQFLPRLKKNIGGRSAKLRDWSLPILRFFFHFPNNRRCHEYCFTFLYDV